jgi:hypothetical protein
MDRKRNKVSTEKDKTITELRVSLNQCIADCGKLKERNDDLSAQNKELRASKTITPAEQKDIARIRAEHLQVSEEQNKLALWLRDNKAKEIAAGKHTGLSVSEVCIMYMARTVEVK